MDAQALETSTPAAAVGIGRPVLRLEDHRLLTGQGRFTADASAPGQLHAVFLRSPHAHAQFTVTEVQAARGMPGVVAVLTGHDLHRAGVSALPHAPIGRRADGSPVVAAPRLALAQERVRFVGEAIALVVAGSTGQAEDALERIEVDWDPLPACVGAAAAMQPDAPQVWEGAAGNLCCLHEHGDAAAVDQAFAAAAHVARVELLNQRLVPSALEPRAALAVPHDDGRLSLHIGCQMPQLARQQLADALGLPLEQVRILVGDIGGGFGAKSFVYPEYVAVAHAARALGRPVKWVATRGESFLADTHGRDQRSTAELALDPQGRFLAMRVRTDANAGAYLSYLGAVIPTLAGLKPLAGVYRTPLLHVRVRVAFTHTAPVDAYRGAGRPESIYLVERLVEAAARATGIDSVELRRRNLIQPSDMPFRSAMGEVYDSGDFPGVLRRALEAADWDGFAARRDAARARGLLYGRGLAMFIESTGAANPVESVRLRVHAGRIDVFSGTQNMGQGLETAYAQIAAERLGVALERIRIIQGDTDAVPRGGGSGGSRSLFIGGSAVLAACDELRAKRDALEPAGDWFELAQRSPGGFLEVEARVKVAAFSWPNGCHVVEAEVDPRTGVTRLARFVAVDDVGRVVNPLLVHGQAEGAIAQGIGQALREQAVHDPDSGQLLTGSFSDYALPRAADVPPIDLLLEEGSPCRTNPLGSKGAGEGGTIGAPPAVVHAVLDALRPRGVEHLDMPLTPAKVWRALRDAAR